MNASTAYQNKRTVHQLISFLVLHTIVALRGVRWPIKISHNKGNNTQKYMLPLIVLVAQQFVMMPIKSLVVKPHYNNKYFSTTLYYNGLFICCNAIMKVKVFVTSEELKVIN